MNPEPSPELIKKRLQTISEDVPNREQIKDGVFGLLADEESEQRTLLPAVLLAAAGLLIAALLAQNWVSGGAGTINIETAEPPDEGTDVTLPTPFAGNVRIIPPNGSTADTRQDGEVTLTMTVDGSTTSGPPVVKLVAVSDVTTQEVFASVNSSLFDTNIVDDAPNSHTSGDRSWSLLRLESDGGTNEVAFRLAEGSYLRVSGISRQYALFATDLPGGVLVVVLDAPTSRFDEAEAETIALLRTIEPGL